MISLFSTKIESSSSALLESSNGNDLSINLECHSSEEPKEAFPTDEIVLIKGKVTLCI